MARRTLGERIHRAVSRVVGGVLGMFSPVAAVRYLRGRERMLALSRRGYTAGRPDGPNSNWIPANTTGDAEIMRDGPRVLARARDLARNDARVSGAVATMVRNIVRTGIWPQAKVEGARGDALNAELETLWNAWAPTAMHGGKGGSIYALQKLVMRHTITDGEVLVHAVYDPNFSTLPLRFELIECDQIDHTMDGVIEGGNVCRRGVEFDARGEMTAVWVLPYHPGDYAGYVLAGFGRAVRVPVSDIRLVCRRERASQTRGVSWMAPVIMRAFDLGEYDEYEMIGAKVAAAFGVFITSPYPENMQGLDGTPTGRTSGSVGEYIEPGRIERLADGEKIEIAEHSRPGQNYEPFVRNNKRDQAAGFGMSYEGYSKDYSSTNFSGARQALLDERLGYRCVQDWLCEDLLDWMYAHFVRAAYLAGRVALPGYAKDPAPYLAKSWVLPGWGWIDPLKDSQASRVKIELGISSHTREAAAQGEDWEAIVDEQIREEAKLLELETIRAKRRALAANPLGQKQEPAPAADKTPAKDSTDAQAQDA